jgi:hypothetical protein
MKHGHISRNSAKAFFAFVTLGLASACADSTVAPTAEVSAFKAPAAFSRTGGVKIFRVNNSEGITQRIGSHVINIPARAICDPLTSGYGSTTWDNPCSPLIGSILITATVLYDNDNHPYIDFQPAMRFAPDKEVMLFLRNGRSATATQLNVKYCNNLGYCVDESLNDASLKPFRVGNTSVIGRRIKHFSGYMIGQGGACPGTVTQDADGSWWCEEGGMDRRSGYMVASGKSDTDGAKPEDKVTKKKDPNDQ